MTLAFNSSTGKIYTGPNGKFSTSCPLEYIPSSVMCESCDDAPPIVLKATFSGVEGCQCVEHGTSHWTFFAGPEVNRTIPLIQMGGPYPCTWSGVISWKYDQDNAPLLYHFFNGPCSGEPYSQYNAPELEASFSLGAFGSYSSGFPPVFTQEGWQASASMAFRSKYQGAYYHLFAGSNKTDDLAKFDPCFSHQISNINNVEPGYECGFLGADDWRAGTGGSVTISPMEPGVIFLRDISIAGPFGGDPYYFEVQINIYASDGAPEGAEVFYDIYTGEDFISSSATTNSNGSVNVNTPLVPDGTTVRCTVTGISYPDHNYVPEYSGHPSAQKTVAIYI